MRDTRRGFTLIELMMTVAIIGLLSAIAIPGFVGYQLRSRAAERPLVERAIHDAITLLYVREGKYPGDLGGGGTFISCPANPAGAPQVTKRPFVQGVGDWAKLSMTVEGMLYYTYDVYGEAGSGGGRWHIVTAEGDLDGDGDLSTQSRTFTYVGGGLVSADQSDAGGQF